jgi:hypothetical protein
MPQVLPPHPIALIRRDRFREYMKRLRPTAPARQAIEAGLVVGDLHGALYQKLAARADLEPGSQQLLVGGIGSGKTTELLLAEKWLNEQGNTLSLFIDISAETDLSGLNSGALLAAFGLHLVRAFSKEQLQAALAPEQLGEVKRAANAISEFSFGKTESRWIEDNGYPEPSPEEYDDYGPPEPGYYVTVRVPGKLQPPFPALSRDVQDIRKPLETLLTVVQKSFRDVVVLYDGLDRLIGPEKFWAVAHQDLRVLRQLQVSVLAAAPLSVLYGTGRQVSEHFDRVHHVHTLATEPEKVGILRAVLEQRGATELLGPEQVERVCAVSGGVLRDLIILARDAGEEAYLSGSSDVRMEDVEKAVDQLGAGYRRGLGPAQMKALSALYKTKAFDPNSSINMELLVTRRVLEYSATDFRVHPALLPFISEAEARVA